MMNKNKVISVLFSLTYLFLLVLFVKALVPRLALLIFPETTMARVIEWTQEDAKVYVKYEYQDLIDHQMYTGTTEIKRGFLSDLKDKKEIEIKYSKYFPTFTVIKSIGDRKLIFFVFGILLMIFGAYLSFQVVRGKLSLVEFLGVRDKSIKDGQDSASK